MKTIQNERAFAGRVRRGVLNLIATMAFGIAAGAASPAMGGEPLQLLLTDGFPPYTDGQKDFSGLHYEIVAGALDEAGVAYDLQGLSWSRLVRETRNGTPDGSFPWRGKAERFERYNMVGPFTGRGSHTVLWKKAGSDASWSKPAELKDFTIGVVRNFKYASAFEDQRPNLTLHEAYDEMTLIRLLDTRQVDLVIGDEAVLMTQARKSKRLSPDDFERAGPPLDATKRYIAVPKSKTEAADVLQDALDAFRETAAYRSILERYSK